MSEAFNPYRDWLGLEDAPASPDYYMLLGVERNASADRIKRAADYAINRVRKIRPGERAAQWSRLIDELRTAQLELTEPERRAVYDAGLSPTTSQDGPKQRASIPATAPQSHEPERAPDDRVAPDLSYAFPPSHPPAQPDAATPGVWAAPIQAATPPTASYPVAQPLASSQPYGGLPAVAPSAEAYPSYADPMAPVALPAEFGGPVTQSGAIAQPGPAYGSGGASVPPTAGPRPLGYAGPAPLASPTAVPVAKAIALGQTGPAATPYAPYAQPPLGVNTGTTPSYSPVAVRPVVAAYPTAPLTAAPSPMTAPVYPAAYREPAVPVGEVIPSGIGAPARGGKRRRTPLLGGLAVFAMAAVLIGALVVALNTGLDPSQDVAGRPNDTTTRALQSSTRSSQAPRGLPTRAPASPVVPAAKTDLPPLEITSTIAEPAIPSPTPSGSMTSPATSVPPTPVEPPAPQPAPESKRPPSAAEMAQVAQAFLDARAALERQDFDAADALLAEVEGLSKTEDGQQSFAAIKQLAQSARAFADAVRDGFEGLKANQQLQVNNTTILVKDASPERITVEVAPGAVRTFTAESLSLGLKYAIVNTVIAPETSENALAKAAYHATHPAGDIAEARHFLEQAKNAGADVSGLLLVVDKTTPAPTTVASTNTPSVETPAGSATSSSSAPSANVSAAPTPEPVPPPTTQELKELTRLAQTALAALRERNLDEADELLSKAKAAAKLDEHKEKIEHLKQLAYYTREFWRAVEEGLKGLTAGQQLTVADTVIGVVEASPNHLVIRVAGQNRRYPKRDIPGGLAMALANQWLNENDAATRIVKGAIYAVEKKSDPAKARELWQEASTMGVDTSALLATLDEDYDFTKQP